MEVIHLTPIEINKKLIELSISQKKAANDLKLSPQFLNKVLREKLTSPKTIASITFYIKFKELLNG